MRVLMVSRLLPIAHARAGSMQVVAEISAFRVLHGSGPNSRCFAMGTKTREPTPAIMA